MPNASVNALRSLRGRSLTREAVRTLATHKGPLRERFLAIDPEFFHIPTSQLPQVPSILSAYGEIRKAATKLKPRGSEGTIAATLSKSQYSTLERLAEAICALHCTLAETRTLA